ncbi:nucleotidyl transferase AbiEii/AbiGii toxin family protein [Candidatus Poriferisocius sp.]|uniref:nucleotidyl transferase AbiEii/AbiGii toxin family protein n=1 Tax=Candidatus Poriferisocius sp. TaxID=3101276 RepID=UPI003B5C8149
MVSTIAARQQRRARVVFKGGTLLRLCYRRDYRYSEDLDFDWIHPDPSKQAIQEFFDDVATKVTNRYGTLLETRWGANKLNLEWKLPDGQTGVISTDVKGRDFRGVEPTTIAWTILDRHQRVDVSVPIMGYSSESMLAAKLSCIADPSRLAARDYYDLFHLLQDDSID